jgi:MFS family permease
VSVWRRPGFTPLVTSATVSEVGSQVSVLVLPVLAATVLAATPWEMGVLAAAGTAPFLVVGLPAGALVDRWRPRRVMVVCDLVRAGLLVTVPLVAWFGGLGLAQAVAVAFAVGVATVFADVAAQSILPALVDRDDLVRANSVLMTGASAAEVAGPGLGGLLLRVVSAPAALLADVASFLLSAVFLRRVPAPARPPGSGRRALLREIAEGLRYVVGHPVIRRITLCTAGINLASGLREAVVVLFALRTLGLSPSTLGVVLSVGAVGGVLGALTAGRLADLVGQGRVVPLAALLEVPSVALTPLAHGAVLLAVSAAGAAFAAVAYNVAQVSMRQRTCPPELLGRMNASIRTLVFGTPPVGALLGGALAGALGLVPVLWVAVAVTVVAAVPVVFSPLLRDELPEE